jgi:hypothetical protein
MSLLLKVTSLSTAPEYIFQQLIKRLSESYFPNTLLFLYGFPATRLRKCKKMRENLGPGPGALLICLTYESSLID